MGRSLKAARHGGKRSVAYCALTEPFRAVWTNICVRILCVSPLLRTCDMRVAYPGEYLTPKTYLPRASFRAGGPRRVVQTGLSTGSCSGRYLECHNLHD